VIVPVDNIEEPVIGPVTPKEPVIKVDPEISN
jgi:hypothetical protein